MKNLYKIIYVIIFVILCFNAQSQTNVSGGIYSNTTWTLNNSPYIVVDTVVVFPGVTLTIQPGVVVKFDSTKYIEIRNAKLVALGTITDSITFTSNSNSPYPGIYYGINFTDWPDTGLFNHCNFMYAIYSISSAYINIKNSNFENNKYGICNCNATVDSCTFINNTIIGCYMYGDITNCNFINNSEGLKIIMGIANYCNFLNNTVGLNSDQSMIQHCNINHNQTGVVFGNYSGSASNNIENCTINNNVYGVNLFDYPGGDNFFQVKNCIIDSNSYYGIMLSFYEDDSIINCQIKNNYFGITDSSNGSIAFVKIIQNHIENNNIGMNLGMTIGKAYCNKICNNSLYNLMYNYPSGTNIDCTNNYWCSNDSATIGSTIYDGYDNIALGLVIIGPIDTVGCYLNGCNLQLTTTVLSNATCDTCHTGSATVTIANGFGPYTYTWNTAPVQTTQTAHNLSSGTYTVCVVDANGCTACKSVYIDSTNCSGYSISLHGTNATCFNCNDSYAWVIDTTGMAPYSYTWYTIPLQYTDTAIGLHQGTYQVCVVDAYGCVLCDSIT